MLQHIGQPRRHRDQARRPRVVVQGRHPSSPIRLRLVQLGRRTWTLCHRLLSDGTPGEESSSEVPDEGGEKIWKGGTTEQTWPVLFQ